ncbi:MAG: DUF6179 domain-containing protein [Eubacteriales bacterium]|nr:DUF6179 domain-containing protein [Eubacteriales bacterium]
MNDRPKLYVPAPGEITEALYSLLSAQCKSFTGGQSSSLSAETVEALLSSICFSLSCFANKYGQNALLKIPPEKALEGARDILKKRIQLCKTLYLTLLRLPFQPDNVSYRDTVNGMENFFKKYDYYFFADQVPCDIDYQLCLPVSENLWGVEYLTEYIKRLICEGCFCGAFQRYEITALLANFGSRNDELLINVFTPVLSNALGRVLLGNDISTLEVTPDGIEKLFSMFAGLKYEEALPIVDKASKLLCSRVGFTGYNTEYVTESARTLIPRICRCDPKGLFLSLAK